MEEATTNYKLRDWVFSRQRYWGEPIPIIHCPNCGLCSGSGRRTSAVAYRRWSPISRQVPVSLRWQTLTDWVNTTCPCCGRPAKRETNTMPQWAGSSWYFLRYVDNKNDEGAGFQRKSRQISAG